MDQSNENDFPVETTEEDEAALRAKAQERLDALGASLGALRDEWVQARSAAGVDRRMREDIDLYHSRDAATKAVTAMMAVIEAGGPSAAQARRPTRSSLFVGVTRQKTNAGEARLADIVLPSDDRNFGIVPTPHPSSPEGEIAQAAAKVAADLMQTEIDDQLVECDFNGETRKMLHDCAVLGTGVMKGPVVVTRTRRAWRKQVDATGAVTHIQETVEHLRPASFRVDPRRVWPDPAAGDNPKAGRGVWESEDLTKRGVRDLRKQPGYFPDQLRAVLEVKPPVSKAFSDLRVNEPGELVTGDVYEKWTYTGDLDHDGAVAAGVEGVSEDPLQVESVVVEMIGNTVVRAYLNPLEDGALPYDFLPWEKVADSPWGYGIPFLMRAQQQVTNAAWRQMMDNAGIASGPQIVIKPGMVQPADKRWEITPRKVWFASDETVDVRAAFTAVEFNIHQKELEAILALSEKLSDQETAVPMLAQGEKGSAPETVGATQILMSGSNVVLRRLVKQFDDFFIKPHIRRYYDFNMAHSENEKAKGDYDVVARGTTALMIRDIQNQAFMNLLTLATNPVFAPMIDPKRLFERALRAQHVDPIDIMRSDEEIQRIQEEAARNRPKDPRVEAAEIRGNSDMAKVQATAEADMAEIEYKRETAAREHEYRMQALGIERDIEMMKLANAQGVALEKIKAMLADTAIRERTKKEIFSAEAAIKAREGTGI